MLHTKNLWDESSLRYLRLGAINQTDKCYVTGAVRLHRTAYSHQSVGERTSYYYTQQNSQSIICQMDRNDTRENLQFGELLHETEQIWKKTYIMKVTYMDVTGNVKFYFTIWWTYLLLKWYPLKLVFLWTIVLFMLYIR